MTKFIITVHLLDGTITETTRHTKDGLDKYIKDVLAQGDMERFTVDEKVYA